MSGLYWKDFSTHATSGLLRESSLAGRLQSVRHMHKRMNELKLNRVLIRNLSAAVGGMDNEPSWAIRFCDSRIMDGCGATVGAPCPNPSKLGCETYSCGFTCPFD